MLLAYFQRENLFLFVLALLLATYYPAVLRSKRYHALTVEHAALAHVEKAAGSSAK